MEVGCVANVLEGHAVSIFRIDSTSPTVHDKAPEVYEIPCELGAMHIRDMVCTSEKA
jgi:hypothetical protein